MMRHLAALSVGLALTLTGCAQVNRAPTSAQRYPAATETWFLSGCVSGRTDAATGCQCALDWLESHDISAERMMADADYGGRTGTLSIDFRGAAQYCHARQVQQ